MNNSPELQYGASPVSREVGIAAVLAPVLERWRLITLLCGATALLAAGSRLVKGREYDARLVVVTISSQQGASLSGAAALLTGNAMPQGGLQVNPVLVAALAESRRVLTAVGKGRLHGSSTLIAERIAGRAVPPETIFETVAHVVNVTVSKETGLLSISVVLSDTALARGIALAVVEETRRAVVETVRAQATELRKAQEQRVDSASRALRHSQEYLQAFLSTNRGFQQYSDKVIQQQTLQRDVGVTEQVYLRAVNDREAAIAKELEQTPVLVIVDPLPEVLPSAPRRLLLTVVLATTVTLILSLVVILILESLRVQAAERPDEYMRLNAALRTLPFGRNRARAADAPSPPDNGSSPMRPMQ